MRDLIAITTGLFAFVGWTIATAYAGYTLRRRHEVRLQRARIARLIADARAAKAPAKVEPMQFTSTHRGGFSSAKIGKPDA